MDEKMVIVHKHLKTLHERAKGKILRDLVEMQESRDDGTTDNYSDPLHLEHNGIKYKLVLDIGIIE